MKFIDFFAGIGGFRLGMEQAGHECVGHCEIDKFADKSYRAMHDVKESEWYADDITRVEPEELPEADCYCFGFPCQAFSIAGNRRGFEDSGWLKNESLVYFSQKTLRDYSIMTGEERSELSYPQWMSWGTMSNGRCLTAQPLESPKTGKECLLLDILEDEVNEKYFLSETAQKRLMSYRDSTLEQLQQEQGNRKGSERMLLKVNSLHRLNRSSAEARGKESTTPKD